MGNEKRTQRRKSKQRGREPSNLTFLSHLRRARSTCCSYLSVCESKHLRRCRRSRCPKPSTQAAPQDGRSHPADRLPAPHARLLDPARSQARAAIASARPLEAATVFSNVTKWRLTGKSLLSKLHRPAREVRAEVQDRRRPSPETGRRRTHVPAKKFQGVDLCLRHTGRCRDRAASDR